MYLGRLVFPFISKHPRFTSCYSFNDKCRQEQFDIAIPYQLSLVYPQSQTQRVVCVALLMLIKIISSVHEDLFAMIIFQGQQCTRQ